MKRAAWRIVKERHAATAFSGEGAWRFGGRWNSRGTRVVYASATRALAALETLVHLTPPVTFRFVAMPVQFDDSLLEVLGLSSLPADWKVSPPAPSTQELGDTWVREGRSVMLEVPSVIVPGEANYLINPAHPDFRRLKPGKAEAFSFDPRLL